MTLGVTFWIWGLSYLGSFCLLAAFMLYGRGQGVVSPWVNWFADKTLVMAPALALPCAVAGWVAFWRESSPWGYGWFLAPLAWVLLAWALLLASRFHQQPAR
ncbi:hypothetical protein [Gallaecimonas xiamenensis]|nr:hypothetical protein [Gallaecimonas xiamenensis]